ncbi:MAG: tRNA (adenine-N1)-methyltransferase [Euryarchaeota archaeon]|nr:tRNA (adenine-N1)-methyltransferase [Euryarchaeota archaeon]MDE1837251.1 tRNA (adenine-N1)-methyltransferase [Euryarchaeota archaeon]MDE1881622.1 tRNA (adenine-N1)-methyltransferase [Euryarchaeota archaeon]MDE2045145.1 tRNA (adenine-N1)-methyltransferase [Thermoplasmata archaeon]
MVARRKEGESYLLTLTRGPTLIEGLGVLDLSPAIGSEEGVEVPLAGRLFRIFRPSLPDLVSQMRRRAQIITPKDALSLLYLAGVRPGAFVLEAGTGSGGLTLFLATMVGESGHVVSYDRRPEHQKVARENLERSGLLSRVTLRIQDVTHGFDVREADSVILDLPEPWRVLASAKESLRPGGYLATYTPTFNQLEQSVRAMREAGFEGVRALELLERGLHVGEGGTRPEFEMLGHTGFLAAGRRIA